MSRLLLALVLCAGCTHKEPKPEPEKKPLIEGLLLPPAEAGGFRSSVAGCAATPEKEPAATRAALPDESVVTSAVASGIILTHEVPHACCLAAKTTVEVVADRVTITDTLSGTPCRCRCSSTIRTAVGLARGDYTVEVKTVEPTQTRSAWTGAVSVQ